MNTLARHRPDLRNKYRLPVEKGGWIDLPNWTPCRQPNELDGEFYNVILLDEKGKELHRVPSIDLEFKTEVN